MLFTHDAKLGNDRSEPDGHFVFFYLKKTLYLVAFWLVIAIFGE